MLCHRGSGQRLCQMLRNHFWNKSAKTLNPPNIWITNHYTQVTWVQDLTLWTILKQLKTVHIQRKGSEVKLLMAGDFNIVTLLEELYTVRIGPLTNSDRVHSSVVIEKDNFWKQHKISGKCWNLTKQH